MFTTSQPIRPPGLLKNAKTDLLQSIDGLVFLQLGILYYFDGLTSLLLLRAAIQVVYVQSRPSHLQSHLPVPAQLPPVLISNFICLITHFLHARPESTSRSSRGYMHGGLIINFVGELGPIGKWRLLLQDVFIFGLQILMLIIANEKESKNVNESDGTADGSQSQQQDIEAEEAGVSRAEQSRGRTEENAEGIEMQPLLPDGSTEPQPQDDRFDEDMIIQVDIRQGLRYLVRRRLLTQAATSTTAETSGSAGDATNLSFMLGRLAAGRPADGAGH